MALTTGNPSTAVQLITLFLTISSTAAAPIQPPSTSSSRCAHLNATQALTQMKHGMEVVRRIYEGKLFSIVQDENDARTLMESNGASISQLSKALNITCGLRDAKDNLWSLDARTGEQANTEIRALRHFSESLVQISCEWIKHILSQLYPGSELQLQCYCDEINQICDAYNALAKAKETILIMETYKPSVSGEISWIEANLPQPDSTTPLLHRFIQYVHNEPVGL